MELLQPAPAPLPGLPVAGQRGELRQLVTSGQIRLILGFDESRAYSDGFALTRVPRSPTWLLGLFGADGVAVPLIDLDAWAHNTAPEQPVSADNRSTGRIMMNRALRLDDGSRAWAISLTQTPSVVDLANARSQEMSTRMPLSISSACGRLIAHVSKVWTLADNSQAVQVRWASVAQALRQDLSGLTAL